MKWSCPQCQSENEAVIDGNLIPLPQQKCTTCSLVVYAQVDEAATIPQQADFKLEPKPTKNSKEAESPRRKGSSLGTLLFVLGGLGCAALGFVASVGLNVGLAIIGAGLALIGTALIYHIGERLDLILEELQIGNIENRERLAQSANAPRIRNTN